MGELLLGRLVLGCFLVESLIVIVLSISDILKGMSLAKHGPLLIIVGLTVGFVGGEKKIKNPPGVSRNTELTVTGNCWANQI